MGGRDNVGEKAQEGRSDGRVDGGGGRRSTRAGGRGEGFEDAE